jgi:DNA-directed DNA polymerase III PolC
LTDLVPLERARKGLVVTQYDMVPIENLGLAKIDLLSQRSLSVLADTIERLERSGQTVPDLEDWQHIHRDTETRRLIREGRTMGCFYIESPAMRSLLRKLRVDDFEMLTAASSVIRPGVAESGMMQQFIECHNRRREPIYLHPKMRKLLGDTYGVMIYQEDVIKVAHEIAGMSLGEGDLLRRAMSGKMRSRDAMQRLRNRFIDGAREREVPPETAEEIWRQIESFAGYAFCKAHSASYALLSFRVAYLKAHHPAEFLAAVITNRGGFYHHTTYIEEARRMRIPFLPPDITRSDADFTGNGMEIRTGLMQVRGVSAGTLRAIETARKTGGPFLSLRDFRERTGSNVSETERLIRAGAFASLGMTRPEVLWRLYLMARKERSIGGAEGETLFAIPSGDEGAVPVPELPEYPPERQLSLEVEAIGYNVSRHPLEAFRHLYGRMKLVKAEALSEMAGKRVRLLGWLIASKKIDTRTGEFMQFLSLEDLTDTFEVVLFPAGYQRYGAVLRDRGPYLITGRVLEESGCYTINAERVERVAE